MEFSQLHYFRAVAYHKSISKAANEIHVSQPTISMAIAKLENELGAQLLQSKSKPVTLTPIGEKVLKRAEIILLEADNIGQETADNSTEQAIRLRFGMPLTICNDLLIPINTIFLPRHPNMELTLFQYGTEIISEKLFHDQLDLGIICQPLKNSGLEHFDMNPIEFYAYFSPKHHFSSLDVITPEMLAGEKILLSEVESNDIETYILQYLDFYTKDYILSHNGMLVPELSLALAELGKGIAFLKKDMDIHNHDICRLPLFPPLKIPIVIAWKKGRYVSQVQKELCFFLRNISLKESLD